MRKLIYKRSNTHDEEIDFQDDDDDDRSIDIFGD